MNIVIIPIGLICTNCYILIDEKSNDCIVIDPAYSRGKLASYISEHSLNLLGILLTHGHFDHCGGVAELLTDKTVPVYCQVDDVKLASEASKNRWRAPALNCEVTNVISDEALIKLGSFDIKVMFTPGHTPGSVCYFIEDYMFSGDTLFADDIGRTDMAGGSMSDMMKSLAKIATIKEDYRVFPGHGENTTLSHEKCFNKYLSEFR